MTGPQLNQMITVVFDTDEPERHVVVTIRDATDDNATAATADWEARAFTLNDLLGSLDDDAWVRVEENGQSQHFTGRQFDGGSVLHELDDVEPTSVTFADLDPAAADEALQEGDLMDEPIDRFAGAWRFLSNFYPSPFAHDGVEYATNEHFFNAHKSLYPNERHYVAAASTPNEAKRRGRGVRLRPYWDDVVRYDVMRHGLELKFADATLRRLLLETGDAELVEGTTWHDTHWGICVCRTHGGQGENHLGKMLMELRSRLRKE